MRLLVHDSFQAAFKLRDCLLIVPPEVCGTVRIRVNHRRAVKIHIPSELVNLDSNHSAEGFEKLQLLLQP
jgi:hypothetical protein